MLARLLILPSDPTDPHHFPDPVEEHPVLSISWRALDVAVRRFDTLNGTANLYDTASKTYDSFDDLFDTRLAWREDVLARLEERFGRPAQLKAEDVEGGKRGARMVVRVLRRTAGFADANQVLQCSAWLAALLAAVLHAALDVSECVALPPRCRVLLNSFARQDSTTLAYRQPQADPSRLLRLAQLTDDNFHTNACT